MKIKRSALLPSGLLLASIIIVPSKVVSFSPATFLDISNKNQKRSQTLVGFEAPFDLDKGSIGEREAPFDPLNIANPGFEDDISNDLETRPDSTEMSIWGARGLLLLVAAIWGTNFASVKYLANLCFHPPCNHPPSEAAFARFGIAALVSLPLIFRKRLDVVLSGLECGLYISLGYITQALALDTIESGKCAFICSLTVITVPIISAIAYRKPIKIENVIAAVVALSGVSVLEGMVDVPTLLGVGPAMAVTADESISAISSISTASSSLETNGMGPITSLANTLGIAEGDILALGQPLGFGISFTRIEYYQDKFRDVEGSTIINAAGQCIMVGLLSFLWVLYDYNIGVVSDYEGIFPNMQYMIEWHRIAAILWTGIVTTVVAIFLQGTALKTATATDAAITFSSEPVWASLFGLALLGEEVTLNTAIGGAIVLSACLIGALADFKNQGSSDPSS